jgi:hypothetical protein
MFWSEVPRIYRGTGEVRVLLAGVRLSHGLNWPMGRWPYLIRLSLTASLAALALAASASPAAASVTIGQVSDPNSGPDDYCTVGYDWVQPTVNSGNSFVVPTIPGIASLTVSSWTTWGGPEPDEQMTMKMFRAVPGQTDRYQVVGHAGPRTVSPGGTAGNTFPANIPVKPGDLLGLHATTRDWCLFIAPGEENFYYLGDLADNASAAFTSYTLGFRLNIQAVVSPTNAFSIVGTQRNKKKGTATLTVNVPNPGELTGSGKGVKVAGAAVIGKTVTAPGNVKLTIKAKGKKKQKLNETGKAKVNPKITYTPTGGDPSTQSRKLKLKKEL